MQLVLLATFVAFAPTTFRAIDVAPQTPSYYEQMQAAADREQAELDRTAPIRAAWRRKTAFERAPFRRWITLGGAKASESRVADYNDGTLTLERRDGKRIDIRESRLRKADRKYFDGWRSDAHL